MPGGAGINFHNDPAAGGWQVLASLQHGTNIAIDPDVAVDEQEPFPSVLLLAAAPSASLGWPEPRAILLPAMWLRTCQPRAPAHQIRQGPVSPARDRSRDPAPARGTVIPPVGQRRQREQTHRVQREHASVGSGTPHQTSRVQLVEDQIGPRRPRERRAWSCENSNPGKRSAT